MVLTIVGVEKLGGPVCAPISRLSVEPLNCGNAVSFGAYI